MAVPATVKSVRSGRATSACVLTAAVMKRGVRVGQKRLSVHRNKPPSKLCERLEVTSGTTRIAIAVLSCRVRVSSGMPTTGKPSPTRPLTAPPANSERKHARMMPAEATIHSSLRPVPLKPKGRAADGLGTQAT